MLFIAYNYVYIPRIHGFIYLGISVHQLPLILETTRLTSFYAMYTINNNRAKFHSNTDSFSSLQFCLGSGYQWDLSVFSVLLYQYIGS